MTKVGDRAASGTPRWRPHYDYWTGQHSQHAARQVLLLAPSNGLGGGIERYLETVTAAFRAHGIVFWRVDLGRPGPAGQIKMLIEARAALRKAVGPTRIVAGHRGLLPIATLLARQASARGISLVCHGSEVWGSRWQPRQIVERRLMRQSGVRVVAVSSFTAGSLARDCQATVLPPGLSREWFDALASAGRVHPDTTMPAKLVTVFRLAAWREKGLPELIAAIEALGRPDVRLTVCGSGKPPPDLTVFLQGRRWCALRTDVSNHELAAELASADLFVLATRTRAGRQASGEGFGMVVMEAQVAGLPVVVPAHGGVADAYVDGVTGLAPAEETTAALSLTLAEMLADRTRLAAMGERASEWAQQVFAPERHADLACRRLL